MRTLRARIDPWNPAPAVLAGAARILAQGGLVAFPTETVYGLGANALDAEAVQRVYAAKGRPSDNPLILHLSRPEQAESLVFMDDRAWRLAEAFWPGPLTLVLRARPGRVPSVTRGGLDTAALRMPDHPVAAALIEAAGFPLAAPSANLSGRPSPTDAQAVWDDLHGRIDGILDVGAVALGIESTVLDVSGGRPLLLRPGGTPREALEEFLGEPLGAPDGQGERRSPGMRYRHYAPAVPVWIWDPGGGALPQGELEEWAFMGLGPPPGPFGRALCFESVPNYAHGLFAGLRALEQGRKGIVLEWPSEQGLGLGLRDRIRRAAGGRP